MELFKAYIRQCRKTIGMLFLFCILFAGTFALYHLPVRAVLYPALLCGLLGCLCLIADFFHIRKKHERLCEIKNLTAELLAGLPEIKNLEEADYQDIIRMLQKETLELAERTGRRYQDMIEYFTIWVHQIKTPISSMHLALQNEDTPFARKMSSDLFRIEQYVEMVLVFLRLDAESSDYVFQAHSLDAIIKQSVKRFSTEFISKKIRLLYDPVDLSVVTDDKWFSFVLEQLLSNALKYTREGSIRIFLRDGSVLCMEDTGIGIAAGDLPRIFEKGYTGYNGRSDKKASGIGLYLCKRICTNLGIEIKAHSEAGKGTVLELYLENILTNP